MLSPARRVAACAAILTITAPCLSLLGCASPRQHAFPARPVIADLPDAPGDPRRFPMFCGASGAPIIWTDLLGAVDHSSVVIIGELHDDAMGHAMQCALVEDTLDRWPRSAISMEMLERDEQIIVDDYLEGIVDAAAFVRLTFSANWGGEGMWEHWYQPIVDTARSRGARVIAANAPRRYVRLARTAGYERLRSLPRERRGTFDLPRSRNLSAYRDRFALVMSRHPDGDDAADEPLAVDAAREARTDAAFRSQLVWDATMAASIARARPSVRAKVVHLVGQFHSDFDGGLVQELRARIGSAPMLTISMQREWRSTMRDEDRTRAHVIVYTGRRPPKDEPDREVEE